MAEVSTPPGPCGRTRLKPLVAAGVSANLCEAVAGLIEQSDGLDISVTWARTRSTPEALRKVAFSSKDAEILKEAARTFRQRHAAGKKSKAS